MGMPLFRRQASRVGVDVCGGVPYSNASNMRLVLRKASTISHLTTETVVVIKTMLPWSV